MRIAIPFFFFLVVGCTSIPEAPIVTSATTPWPEAPKSMESNAVAVDNRKGSIYSDRSFRSLYSDENAWGVGDSVSLRITERNSASKQSQTSLDRDSEYVGSIPNLLGLSPASLAQLNGEFSGNQNFQGQGRSSMNNTLTGQIRVSVLEVLPNGHLRVGGEKRLGINQGEEWIKITGILDPRSITNQQALSQDLVDARIEYRQKGAIQQSQVLGFLSRFFLLVSPF